jgi:rhomboid protease GluP
MCPNCRAFITTDDKTCPYCDAKVGSRAIDLRVPDNLLGGLLPADRFVTTLLLIVNSAIYVATIVASQNAGNPGALTGIDPLTLIRFGANHYAYVSAGQWWRLLTAGYLHASIFHIFMNGWALMNIGAQVEEIFGASRMTAIWTISTITGFGASYWISAGFSVGASAGLFGLIGAMIALGSLHKNSSFAQTVKSAYLQIAVIQFVMGFLGLFNMDNWAHLGGLAGGYAVAYVAGVDRRDGGSKDQLWNYVAIACILLTLYCFARLLMLRLGPNFL